MLGILDALQAEIEAVRISVAPDHFASVTSLRS